MSEPTEYPVGVPCWVDALRPDPERAVAFYAAVFGWETDDRSGPDAADPYYVCTMRGRAVGAIGSSGEGGLAPAWNTYVRVDSADAGTTAVVDAGGSVVREPYDVPGGRAAIVADPAGATVGLWQPETLAGAQLVNAPGAWSMSMLNTADPEGSTRFYEAVFGWTTSSFDMDGDSLTMWHRPGYVGGEPSQPVPRDVVAVMAPLADPDAPAQWDVNFWASDAEAVAATAADAGGTVIAPPADRPPFRETIVADPDGAVVAVSQLLT